MRDRWACMEDSSDSQGGPSGATAHGASSELPPRPVVISLRIEPGEPISGMLTTSAQTTGTPFCGWMELIAAITARREDHSP
jgi:hypothetical protein